MSDFKVVSVLNPTVVLTAGPAISGGTSSQNTGTIVWSNSNGVSFGLSNGVMTASAAGGGGGAAISAGANSQNTGTIIFANANGMTFGLSNNGSMTASYTVPSTAGLLSNINISAGTASNNLSAMTLANSNGISFGLNGSVVTATVKTDYQSSNANYLTIQSNQTMGLYAASNTTGQSSSTTIDARSLSFEGAGVASVGYSNGSVVISVPSGGGAGDGVNIIAAGTQTANTTGTVLFGNANGISFGMSNNSVVTASYTTPPAQTVQPVAMSGSNGSFNFSTATFGNSNGMLFYTTNGSMVGSYTVPSIAGLISAINVSGGATSNNLSAITFNNSNGVSFGLTGSVMTATVKTDYQSSNANYLTSQSNQAISGSNGSFAFQTATFGNSNGLSFYTTNGSMVGSYTVNGYNIVQAGTIGTTGTTWSSLSATVYLNGSGAMTVSQNNSNQIVLSVPPVSSLSATGIVSISTNGRTISIGASVPALSVWEPFPLVTGSSFSSHTPGSWWVNRFVIGNNLTMSNFQVILSLNASVPAATSAASTGTAMYSYSRGITLLKRQDYGANSTNLTTVATASFGLTAGLSYSSTSQSFVMSWVTNSTGGTSSYNTTSNGGGWSSFLTGPKMISIPCITSLGQGEYFLAHNHSSTTGTTNSNVTLMSISALHIAPQLVTIGLLGESSTLASFGINGIGNGIASGMTTNAAMPGSAISVGTNNMIYVNMSNA